MKIPNEVLTKNPSLQEWSILLGYRGSIAHGMYVPPKEPTSIDDKDLMGVCIPPLDHYFGLKVFGSHGTQEIKEGEWDIVVYETRKFVQLLAQGNPNVLSLLWLAPNYYVHVTEAGHLLIENRNLFVGRHVYHSFTGYAHSQLHRMTHNAFQGHMGEKRRQLVEKFGFDTKNAAHLIRLLRMGTEFLIEGDLHVLREDAKQLLEIKRGEWSLDQIMREADKCFSQAQEAYMKSTLPNRVDMDKVNALCESIVQTHIYFKENENG